MNSCYKQSQKSYVLAAKPYMIHSWLCRILLKDVPCSQMKKHDDSMPINIFHPTLASHLSLAPVAYCGISPPSPNEPWSRLVNSSLRLPHQSWKSGPRCKMGFCFCCFFNCEIRGSAVPIQSADTRLPHLN